jgi:glycosyltransferase involved in cell wall biosynthesis
MNRVAIVMPIYNEQRILVEVISDWMMLLTQVDGVLICVNDGSVDQSLEILNNLKQRYCDELIILDQKNRGHGAAVVHGYQYAIRLGVDYIFQTDSDNQIPSTEFFKLWKHRDRNHFTLGHREFRDDSWIRVMMSRLLHLFIDFLFQSKLLDSNVPFRLMPTCYVKQFLKKTPMKQAFAPNLFLSLYAEKFHAVKIVSVKHRKRISGKNSLNIFRMTVAIARTLKDLFVYKRFNLEEVQNHS